MTARLNLFTLVMLNLLLMMLICSLYSPECVFLVFMMVRDPVWLSSFSLSLNLSSPSSHWTSVQVLFGSPVISAMRMPLKYHISTSFGFLATGGSKVTDSPLFLLTSSISAAETPETQSNRRLKFFRWKQMPQHQRTNETA